VAYPPEVERWRSLVARYFPASEVDKALYVISLESSGNPSAVNPSSNAAGLFQVLPAAHGNGNWTDPETNVKKAAELYGQSGWKPWGENNLYNGKPFGALGLKPYLGSSGTPTSGGNGMTLPVTSGRITAVFGPTDEPLDSGGVNKGVDFGVPVGTGVNAVVGGTVIAVGDQKDGWGISVKVRDANGNVHNYGHLSTANVKVGDTIQPGNTIAKSGNTGASTGPHLSYDVLGSGGQYIDPSSFLGFNAAGSNVGYQGMDIRDLGPLESGPVNGRGPTAPTSTMNPEGIDWGAMADQYDQLITTIMGAKPTPEEWTDEAGLDGEGYRMDLAEWQTMLTGAIDTRIGLDQAASGIVSLDDGTIISESQYAMLDPSAKQQVDAAIANRNANLTNSYATQLNELGLAKYNLATGKVAGENQRLIDDFNNKISAVTQSLSFDNTNLRQAEAAIGRALDGLTESRGRATLIQQAKEQQRMYGTSNGKTSFTGADLGGGVSALARQAGIGASDPVISYPGFTTMDPEGDMARFDERFGVTGPLPDVPGLITDPGQIPGAPGLLPNDIPLPSFLLPSPPTTTGGIGNSSLLGGYGGGGTQFSQGGGPTPPGFSTNPLSQYFVDAQPQSGGLLPNGLGLADSQYLNSSAAMSVLQPWRAYRPNPIGTGLLGG